MKSLPQRITPPSTAFSLTGTLRKHPRVHNGKHLTFIRSLPCVVCGTRRGVEAAHVKMSNPLYGKSHPGGAAKADDSFTVPLCMAHHDEQHGMSEADFWMALNIDPLALALALFNATGDEERAEGIIRAHREIRP